MRQVVQNYTTGPKGLAQVGYKDVSLAVTVGHDVGASLPVAALVSQLMEQLFQKEEAHLPTDWMKEGGGLR